MKKQRKNDIASPSESYKHKPGSQSKLIVASTLDSNESDISAFAIRTNDLFPKYVFRVIDLRKRQNIHDVP